MDGNDPNSAGNNQGGNPSPAVNQAPPANPMPPTPPAPDNPPTPLITTPPSAPAKSKKWMLAAVVGVVVIALLGAGAWLWLSHNKKKPVSETAPLTIFWAQWKPADYLQQLTSDFTKETGIKVKVVQDSWSTWDTTFTNEMKKKQSGTFDMAVGDSQWLGRGSTRGDYVDLTKWIADNKIADKFTKASMTGYAEYPKGGGHYWALPLEGDAAGFSYRKDLFENSQEKAAFKAKYGYDLAVPKTWVQLKDIAEFFYRPQQNLYGALMWTEPKYDGITMGMDAMLWSWGADLGNQKTYKVDGVLNTKEGVEALEFYKSLNQYNNPKWVNYYLDTNASSNQPMMDGQVAMAMGYFAINPELLDKTKNPNYYDKIGFFAPPKGPAAQYASLGGQGISIVSYTQKKEQAFQFLQWLSRDDVQKKWAKLGGLTCNKTVQQSEEFLNASPLNRPFVEAMGFVKDFWATPEYTDMLAISQKYWYEYVVEGKITAQEAMNNIAKEWEGIFDQKGYYKE